MKCECCAKNDSNSVNNIAQHTTKWYCTGTRANFYVLYYVSISYLYYRKRHVQVVAEQSDMKERECVCVSIDRTQSG